MRLRKIKDVKGRKELPLGNLPLGNILYLCNTISKNKKVLKDKDIIEERKGRLRFVDPVYQLWFSQEY